MSVLSRGPSMDAGSSRELSSMLDGLDDYIAVLQAQQEKPKSEELETTNCMPTGAEINPHQPSISEVEREVPVLTESNIISFEAGTPVTVLQSAVALDGHIDHVTPQAS